MSRSLPSSASTALTVMIVVPIGTFSDCSWKYSLSMNTGGESLMSNTVTVTETLLESEGVPKSYAVTIKS